MLGILNGLRVSGEFVYRSADRVQTNMEKMIGKVERSALRESVRKSSLPMHKSARAKAVQWTGALSRSLIIKLSTARDRQSVTATVGPNKNYTETHLGKVVRPVRYAHLVEWGAYGHHGTPYMRPAFDENKGTAQKIFAASIAPAIQKAAKRVNARELAI